MEENKAIMDMDEVSAYLHMSKSTIYKLAQEGRIPCQKVGRHWRFNREGIDLWLANQTAVAPVAESAQVPLPSGFARESQGARNVPGPIPGAIKSSLAILAEDPAPFFHPKQRAILKSNSISNIGMLLIQLATDQGKKQLAELLEISLSELDRIASDMSHYLNQNGGK